MHDMLQYVTYPVTSKKAQGGATRLNNTGDCIVSIMMPCQPGNNLVSRSITRFLSRPSFTARIKATTSAGEVGLE